MHKLLKQVVYSIIQLGSSSFLSLLVCVIPKSHLVPNKAAMYAASAGMSSSNALQVDAARPARRCSKGSCCQCWLHIASAG